MIQLNFKFFNVLFCFIVLGVFLGVLHEILPDLSCPTFYFHSVVRTEQQEVAGDAWCPLWCPPSCKHTLAARPSPRYVQSCPARGGCLALHQGLLCWLKKGYWHHPPRAVPGRHAGTTELCSESDFNPLSFRNLDFCPYLAVPQKSKHRYV